MSITSAPIYKDFGGQKLGITLSSFYNPQKHLESNSFASIAGPQQTWLGIMNYLEMYEQAYNPLVSMQELTKNTVFIDSNQHSFYYGQPYKLGCPFIMEVLCENNRLGYGGTSFHVVLSENLYTYNDILLTDRRNGKGLRVVPPNEAGEDAKIIPYKGGFRYLLVMSSGDEKDYIDLSEIIPGWTEIERVDFSGGDEFVTESTNYTGNLLSSGSNRYGMDLYQFNVGLHDMSLSYLMTADATMRDIKQNPILPQLVGLPAEASSQIINFFQKSDFAGKQGAMDKLKSTTMWLPKFLVALGKELKDLEEMKLMYSPGWTRSNGREIIHGGLGLYPQIKAKGNRFFYSTPMQAYDLIKNMLVSLYSGKYNVPMNERRIKIELGDAIFEHIQPMFAQYFKSDNNYLLTLEHAAMKNVLTLDKNGEAVYKPLTFGSVFYPNFGWIEIVRNPYMSRLDSHKKNQEYIGRHTASSWMIFIKDITDSNFTKADIKGSPVPANSGNLLYIKRAGIMDSMEYTVGSGYISPALLSAIGAGSNTSQSRDNSFNGVKLTMRAAPSEVFLQDASRMIIAEYDPTGEREAREKCLAKTPIF
jgi:hypothetical protein